MVAKARNLKIGIIGVGMVGEPIRRWFEEKMGYRRGVDLQCYDVDPKKGYFDDVNKSDIVFVAGPTPPNPDGSCNISIVDSMLAMLKGNKVVVIKSTVPPGTTEMLQKKYSNLRLIFNPEFLTESQAWEDFINPSRQLVGYTDKSKEDALLVLSLLPRGRFRSPHYLDYWKFELNATEAEVVKYASNVFGACKVIFGNMLADYCLLLEEAYGLKVSYDNVRQSVSADTRIDLSWLDVYHGSYRGFGGYCFPKDLRAHIEALKKGLNLIESSNLKTLIQKGINILEAVWDYNVTLLALQNLTVEDVSKHDKEIILHKKREIK